MGHLLLQLHRRQPGGVDGPGDAELQDLLGTVTGAAPAVLFGPFPDREAVWQALLDAGVLIRVVGPEGFLRASIGTPEEMARLRAALTSAIGR